MTPNRAGGDTRSRLLRVAAELFARQGYHATGMAELGEAAQLGRGALYHHIGSKEQLLFDVCSRHVINMVEFAETVVGEPGPVVPRLRRLCRQLLGTIAQNKAEVTVFFREVNSLTGQRHDQLIAARDRFEKIWQELLEQGITSGELERGGPLLVKGMLGLFNYSYLWLRPDGAMSPEEVADELLDALLLGIARRPSPAALPKHLGLG